MKKKRAAKNVNGYKRQLFSLPPHVVDELATYAAICRNGNKSRFVADAIEAYIDGLRRHRHTQKLRQSYAAAAEHSLMISDAWEHLDDEAWAQLDKLEASARK